MTTAARTTPTAGASMPMADHPDMIELRDRLDRVSETTQARTVEGLAMLAGLYVAISPWILGFASGNTALAASSLIVGLAVAVLAMDLGSAYSRAHGMSWVLPVLGAWIIVGQFVTVAPIPDAGVIVSNAIAGGLIVVLGAAALTLQRMRMPHRH